MSAIVLAAAFPIAAPAAGSGGGLERLASTEARCITEGLRPLTLSLTAPVISREAGRVNTPSAAVVWSGRPLRNSCGAHVSVSFDIRLWFEKVGSPLDLGAGPNGGWQVFWSGKRQVRRARKVYDGPTFTASIGCMTKARGWLRYTVFEDGNEEVLAQRKEAVPVRHSSCH